MLKRSNISLSHSSRLSGGRTWLDEAESTVDIFSWGLRRAFSHPQGRSRGPKMSAHQRPRHVLSGSLAGRQMALVFCSCESQISHSAGRLRFSRAGPSVRTSEFRKSQLCRSVAPLAATSDLFNVSLHLRGETSNFLPQLCNAHRYTLTWKKMLILYFIQSG